MYTLSQNLLNMKSLYEYGLELMSRMPINEIAYERKQLLEWLEYHVRLICQNWCLVRYCSVFDPKNQNKKHWSTELQALIIEYAEKRTKLDKRKITKIGFIDQPETFDYTQIYAYIGEKFKKEHIDLIRTEYIAKEMTKHLNEIVDLLSIQKFSYPNDDNKIKDYCYNKI